jgi:REP element-mobilizing transposase RayT
LRSFKSCTAARLIELLEAYKAERLLARLRLAKRAHKHDRKYRFWQVGSQAEIIISETVMRQNLEYVHQNPVKRGYVDQLKYWRPSSARNYLGQSGLIAIDPWF